MSNDQNDMNLNMEAQIAGDETEMDNYITCTDENGVEEDFYADDVLTIDVNGEERDYVILVPKAEMDAVEAGEKTEPDTLVIARWVESEGEGDDKVVDIVPITDPAEEKIVSESIAEFYQEQEAALEGQATAE